MARAIAGATVSFGLVSIPVKLYPATQSTSAISFNLLHKACGTRLKQQYICPHDQEIVSRDDMVKGYEFAKDQYVTFNTEELKALEEKATHSIDIAESEELATPPVATAPWGYLRLRRQDYDRAALDAWAERIQGQTWETAYVFFKHEDEAKGPDFAATFTNICGETALG